jgi:hypothetical protein
MNNESQAYFNIKTPGTSELAFKKVKPSLPEKSKYYIKIRPRPGPSRGWNFHVKIRKSYLLCQFY